MNNTFYAPNDYRLYLEHHGIKGMKWGVRRFQNSDGSYTQAGRSHYGVSGSNRSSGGARGALRSIGRKITGADLTEEQRKARNAKAAKIALAVAGTAAVAAGAYAARKYLKGTLAEAESHMYNRQSKVLDDWLERMSTANESQWAARSAWDKHVDSGTANTPQGQAAYKEYRKAVDKVTDAMNTRRRYAAGTDKNMADKKVRRAAQRAVVARDLANQRNKLRGRGNDIAAQQKMEERLNELLEGGRGAIKRRR